MIKFTFS